MVFFFKLIKPAVNVIKSKQWVNWILIIYKKNYLSYFLFLHMKIWLLSRYLSNLFALVIVQAKTFKLYS